MDFRYNINILCNFNFWEKFMKLETIKLQREEDIFPQQKKKKKKIFTQKKKKREEDIKRSKSLKKLGIILQRIKSGLSFFFFSIFGLSFICFLTKLNISPNYLLCKQKKKEFV